MRILLVTPTQPSHPSGGGPAHRRVAALLDALRGMGHAVHLCLLRRHAGGEPSSPDPPSPEPHAEGAAGDGPPTVVEAEPPPAGPRGRPVFGIDDWCPPGFATTVAALAERLRADAVLATETWLSGALTALPEGTLRLLDVRERHADRHLRLLAAGRRPTGFYTDEAEERLALDRADLLLAPTEEDRIALEARSRTVALTLAEGGRPPAPLASRAALARLLDRPRVLLVTDLPFWEERLGNHARIAELLRVARARMDADVFLLRDAALAPGEEAAVRRLLGRRGRVSTVSDHAAAARAGIAPDRIEALTQALLPYERGRISRAQLLALEAHLRAGPAYDAAILQYLRLSWLRLARGMPAATAIDIHDVMSLRDENFTRFGREHFLRLDLFEEAELLDRVPLILAIQHYEHRLLDRLFPGRVLYLPFTAEPVATRRDARRPVRRVVFVGGDSPMNRDGLAWFLEQVWPCFAASGAGLHVAGAVCAALPPEGARGLVAHGPVADLAGFLAAADIAVNPVFYGGGLKTKTVEYLCHGLPAVLTEEAVFGIEGGAGEAWLPARSRTEFVAALDRLMHDAALRVALSAGALRFGRRAFARPLAARSLDALAALGKGGGRVKEVSGTCGPG